MNLFLSIVFTIAFAFTVYNCCVMLHRLRQFERDRHSHGTPRAGDSLDESLQRLQQRADELRKSVDALTDRVNGMERGSK